MTVEYQETRYGRPHGEPQIIDQVTEDLIKYIPPLNYWHIPVGEILIVESNDRIQTLSFAGRMTFPLRRFEGDEINRQNFKSTPLAFLKDLFLWRRRHYTYRPDPKTPPQS